MQRCYACKTDKEVSEFGTNRHRKNGLQTQCKTCRSDYLKKWYKANTKLQIRRAKKSTALMEIRNKEFIASYLLSHPCIDCNNSNILVLQFDHVKGNKEFNIARCYRLYSLEVIKQEVEKCEVRCANCHQEKTATRRKDWKLNYLGR